MTVSGPSRPSVGQAVGQGGDVLTGRACWTVAQAADRFLDHCRFTKNLADNTVRAYAVDLAEFGTFAGGGLAVADVDRDLLRRYMKYLFECRELKETSVKRRMACLKVLFRWLEQEDQFVLSPFHRLDARIRLPRRLPRALAGWEAEALVRAQRRQLALPATGVYRSASVARRVSASRIAPASRLLALEIMLRTGVRVSELCGIAVADLDPAEASIRIHGKGDRERRVFLVGGGVSVLVAAFAAVRRGAPVRHRFLLVGDGPGGMAPQQVRRWLSELARAAGLERHVTPHMLRHTAATRLLESGVDIRYVQRLLGHQSITTTERYTAVTETALRRALERER